MKRQVKARRAVTSDYAAYAVEGNTARKLNRREREHVREQSMQYRKPAYRQAERSAIESASWLTTAILVISVAVAVLIGYRYLQLVSSVDMHRRNVDALTAQLDALTIENDSLEKSIDYAIDLEHVYEVAVNELGMVPVGNKNIIQYDKTESEYVIQGETVE